jgi:DNA-binding GntR family transcriptional regulator
VPSRLDAGAAIALTQHDVTTSTEQTPVSVAGRVADQLRDLIRDGAYAPGARLVERSLARELGTSHIPVREALARLAEEGLVVRLPRRGARVAELSPRLLQEISSVRVVLEQFVCRRVLERWTPSAHAELAGLARKMTAAAERGSTKTVGELDVRFHETLWQLADHELLLEVAGGLRGRIERFLRAANAALEPDEMRHHAESHVELVALLDAGDEAAVAAAMQRHIEVGAERVARAGGLTS